MKPLLLIASSVACCISSQAIAADREFKDVVRAISDEFQTKPMHIPMFGLANVVLKVAHPAGAKHVELAIFQNVDRYRTESDLVRHVKSAVGRDWQPFVQVHSDRGRQTQDTLVYMREAGGRDVNLLVVTMQDEQVVVVEAKVDPKELQKFIESPESAAKRWGGIGRDNWHDDNLDN
jgi:hypothetical protein